MEGQMYVCAIGSCAKNPLLPCLGFDTFELMKQQPFASKHSTSLLLHLLDPSSLKQIDAAVHTFTVFCAVAGLTAKGQTRLQAFHSPSSASLLQ